MTTATPAAAQRQSNAWLVLAVFLLIYVFNYADRYLISGLVDPIKAEFGVGDRFIPTVVDWLWQQVFLPGL